MLAAGPALAADLQAPAAVAAYNWSGLYLGGTVAYAWGTFDPKTNTSLTGAYFPTAATVAAVNAAGAQSIKPKGVPVGVEAGYNWQAAGSPWVFGIEADIQSLRLSGGAQTGLVGYPGFPGATFNVSSSASANWMFTLRPRLGWSRDHWLFYVTGGLALTQLNAAYAFADSGGAVESAVLSTARAGYTAGGGVEVALRDGWSAKAEYLFVDFGPASVTSSDLIALTAPVPGQPFTHGIDLKANIARIGFDYRLDPADSAATSNISLKAAPRPWNWTGLYVGAHLGAAGGATDFADPFGTSVFGDNARTPGFLGGEQIGYNWQAPGAPWVFGIEAELSAMSADGTVTCYAGSQQQINATCESRPLAAGALTGRFGYALGPLGHTLIYGKGGLGWAVDRLDMAGNVAGIAALTNFNTQTVPLWGGTIGVGIEQALTPAWSVKVEYDYLALGSSSIANVGSFTCVPVHGACDITAISPPGTSGVTQNLQELMVGLNYRWGGDPWARWPQAAPGDPGVTLAKAPVGATAAWEFAGGSRYFGSWGQYHKDLGLLTASTLPTISSVSRLTYDDMQTHSGELFGRLDTPWNLFIKSYIGGGITGNGHMNDEDFIIPLGGGLFPYSNTLTPVVDGAIGYGAVDGGYDFLRASEYKVGAFAGYFELRQNMQGFGCSPMAAINCIPPIPLSGSPAITENATWRALRIGAGGEAMLSSRLKLGGEVAYLPYTAFDAVDQHFFGNTGILASNNPESGHGQGVQAEIGLSYDVTPQLSVGVGGRYWGLWTTSATIFRDFDATGIHTPTPPQYFKAVAEEAGAFVQTSYKFSQ